MNRKAKKSMRKILPVGIAMGILFSASPVTEYKVKADVDTFATIVTTFGDVYDAFLKEPFENWLGEQDAKNSYAARLENVAYKAPTFNKGEFSISVFDYNKDQNFSKKIKIAYANGKVEYKTIKHGEQIRIKDAGTIVDLTSDEPELSKHDILYITQKQLEEGNTGVSLTNFKTYYLKSDNSGSKNVLAARFEQQEFPAYFLTNGSGLRDIRYVNEDLFSKLPEEKRMLATITSEPVGKDVLSNYVTNNSEALADLNNRLPDILADRTSILETPIALPFTTLNDGKPYQIIPYKKGTNKVLVKTGSKYLSGKEGNALQYSDSIGDDEVFELVQIDQKSFYNNVQFHLKNRNGVSLAGNQNIHGFATDWSFKSEIRFTAKSNNEIHNWLREWYPGKENEKQKYDGIQIIADEKDPTKQIAKDSSGTVIKNSWVNRDGNQYYAGSDGILLIGWHEVEGKTYYFELHTGLINANGYQIDGKYYNFHADGSVVRSAWKEDQNGLHYSDDSGAIVKEGLREIDDKIYYFKDYGVTKGEIRLEDQHIILHFSDKGVLERASKLNGEALDNVLTYVDFKDKELVFEKGGSIRKNGISKVSLPAWSGEYQPVLVYYSLEDGRSYTGWKEVDGKKYYFKDGENPNFDRNETIDGKKYYFNNEGEALPTGFVDIDGRPFYLNDKSEKVTGVHEINGELYLFSKGDDLRVYGEKVRNTDYRFEGKGYYAGVDGRLYRNTETDIWVGDTRYRATFNNEGVITKIYKR
ncbi:N-acetylmuramoyl-L-alanine amidase family protein [Bacillus thuringiensis]|uniref:N-acetylmuramoyl-L-alanine amidase family protein n=1 Tax=Bacillus thuringiensis TaxID=1428 RepID=UPI0020792032|nr:cell wall-binding protein [Bacillus thuringiensis]USL16638.1 cell wall-binding protein [Bacillus thuringiensis]